MTHGVVTGHGHLAGRGGQQGDKHPNNSGFARTVGPEESEYLAFAHMKVDTGHGFHWAEVPSKPLG